MVREASFCMRGREYEIRNGSECGENLTVQCLVLHTDITLSKAEETLKERVQKEPKSFDGKGCREVLSSQLLHYTAAMVTCRRPAQDQACQQGEAQEALPLPEEMWAS